MSALNALALVILVTASLLVVSGRRDGLSWKGALGNACNAAEGMLVWVVLGAVLMLLLGG